MFVDRESVEKYADEYDVKVRRLSDTVALTSSTKEAMGMAISTFAPGETVREHVNKPNVQEIFMILAGDVEVVIDGEREVLQAGDLSFAEIGQSHRFTNLGDDQARLLSIWWRATVSTPLG